MVDQKERNVEALKAATGLNGWSYDEDTQTYTTLVDLSSNPNAVILSHLNTQLFKSYQVGDDAPDIQPFMNSRSMPSGHGHTNSSVVLISINAAVVPKALTDLRGKAISSDIAALKAPSLETLLGVLAQNTNTVSPNTNSDNDKFLSEHTIAGVVAHVPAGQDAALQNHVVEAIKMMSTNENSRSWDENALNNQGGESFNENYEKVERLALQAMKADLHSIVAGNGPDTTKETMFDKLNKALTSMMDDKGNLKSGAVAQINQLAGQASDNMNSVVAPAGPQRLGPLQR